MTTAREITLRGNMDREAQLRGIARELARDILDRDRIMEIYGVSQEEFDRLIDTRAFGQMFREELQLWAGSTTARERIDLKTLAIIENNLPTMHEYLNDPKFSDTAKVEIFKALQKGVGIGNMKEGTSIGEKISITINMGDDKKLTVEHAMPVIEGVVIDGND